MRADNMKHYTRGNQTRPISFVASQEHASAKDAELFLTTGLEALPEEGDLVLTLADETTQVKIVDAILKSASGSYFGATTEISYSFIGGEFVAVT